jgi:hypothetical protein
VLRAATRYQKKVTRTRTKVLFSGFNDDRRRRLMAGAIARGAKFSSALDRAALALGVAAPSTDVVVTETTAPGSGYYGQGQTVSIQIQIAPEVLQEGPVTVTASYNRFRVLTDASVGTDVIPQNPAASAPLVTTMSYTTAETRGVARFRVKPLLRGERARVIFNSVDGTLPAIDE